MCSKTVIFICHFSATSRFWVPALEFFLLVAHFLTIQTQHKCTQNPELFEPIFARWHASARAQKPCHKRLLHRVRCAMLLPDYKGDSWCSFLFPCADDRAEEAEAANWPSWSSPSHEHQSPAACLRSQGGPSFTSAWALLTVHHMSDRRMHKNVSVSSMYVGQCLTVYFTKHSYDKCI